MRFDTVIIGAGMSGLAAGIRLAHFDQSVCVLERHTTIGGLNSFYRLRNRNYDVGMHAVTNYASPGTRTGPLSKLLRQLRLRWQDFGLVPQQESLIAFGDKRLRFNNDFAFFVEQVAQLFPKQVDHFRRLVQRIDEQDETALQQEALSARSVLTEFITDRQLIDMILCPLMFYGSAAPHDMDFNQFVVMFKSIFQQGFGRPFDGIRLILKSVVRRFKSLGGQLWLRRGVQSIRVENGRAVGVVLDDNTEIEADNVLSSAGYVETMNLCPQSHRPAQPDTPGRISFVESQMVLDRQPADIGHDQTIIFYNDSAHFVYAEPDAPCDLRSGIICSPNNFCYDELLSEGLIRITALANSDYWINLPNDAYEREKQVWFDEMSRSARRFMPDCRDAVIDTDVFTPRTIKKFTGHINGAVYGAPKKRLDGRTHLDNLYICGTDQGFLGIVGSMLSGITIANLHLLKRD